MDCGRDMRPGSRPGAAGGCNSLSEERLVCSGNSVDLLLMII